MTFDEFQKLRAARSDLLDIGELNLYRAFSPRFAPIVASTHRDAGHRCHLAEKFLERLGLPEEMKCDAVISHGVRRSLSALFSMCAERNMVVGVPSDVYPIYAVLAQKAGARIDPWPSRHGLPGDAFLSSVSALLVCDPLKPWGGELQASEVTRLQSWARANLLLIDSAYAFPARPVATGLWSEGDAVLLLSLSKGWLIPDHGGLCLTTERWRGPIREAFERLPKDEHKLRIAYAALVDHGARISQVTSLLEERAARLNALTSRHPEWNAAPVHGYFARARVSFEKLMSCGVLGVPGSVFGASDEECVLSSL